MSEGNSGMAVSTRSTRPASIEIAPERGSGHGQSVTGVATKGLQDGVIELSVPNLLPTDNATEVFEVPIHRLKIPVRISAVSIRVVDNGYVVELPNAGKQHVIYGPDGAHHVFSGPDAKARMLEFVALVIGQVTYQYREVEADDYHRIKRHMQGRPRDQAEKEEAAADAAEMQAAGPTLNDLLEGNV